jgi:hypothetical protein
MIQVKKYIFCNNHIQLFRNIVLKNVHTFFNSSNSREKEKVFSMIHFFDLYDKISHDLLIETIYYVKDIETFYVFKNQKNEINK